jgi:uncharacterized membrane protein (UPF0182 family)
MRRSSELPRRSRWARITPRAILIGLAVAVLSMAVFGRAIAQFYVDALWHDGLGRSDVFWGQLSAKATLFALCFLVFLLVAGVNLYAADRAAPAVFPANVHPYVERFHEVFGHRLRIIRYAVAVVLAFMLALPAAARWQDWVLFRHSRSFGVTDRQFGVDVGFYVFELPFLTFAVDWLFAALVTVLLLTIAAHLLNGGVLFTSSTPTVRPATRVHIAVLLAVLAAVKAADYWLARYELTNDQRGFVQGATYTVVKAQIPALMLLVLIALLTAGLFLSTIRTNKWRLPVVASVLWLLVAVLGNLAYPAFVQRFLVRPNQEAREAPYVERNVNATLEAMGLDDVRPVIVKFTPLDAAAVEADPMPLENARLLNPGLMLSRFAIDREKIAGLQVADLDVDRMELDGRSQQVLMAALELDIASIPNKSWQGRHLASTRGCGVVVAPASQVSSEQSPLYADVDLNRPELYFSPAIESWGVTRTDVDENACGDGAAYTGDSGVEMGGPLRRAAFALAFLDYNILGSSSINDDSQMLFVRSVTDRVQKLAPFLDFDGDPYPVAVGGGVQWVLDAYTSTDRYPYAQRIGNAQLTRGTGLSSSANYVRNSVKAVVDAYTGEVTFYVVDPADPILRAWWSAFPKLFTDQARMPDELRQHLRYPEDLFRAQTELYSKYQLGADDFFDRENAWSVADAPATAPVTTGSAAGGPATAQVDDADSAFTVESNRERFVPYYTLLRNPETGEDEFVLLRPFSPLNVNDRRTELNAYMTAASDPEDYGALTVYRVEQSPLPAGPYQAARQSESDKVISPQLSLQHNPGSGSLVWFGDTQLVPVGDGLLYVRPVYVETNKSVEYRFVIVSDGERSVMKPTLGEAVAGLFPGFDAGLLDGAATTPTQGEPSEQPDEPTTPTGTGATPADLLARADVLFDEADDLLRAGDLGGYQDKIDQAQALVQQALAALEG